MKAKKISKYLFIFFLTLGASITLGFLSFGGMLALIPILPLAIAAFVLSTAYEGEIHFQNIKSAIDKLFGRNHLKRAMASQYLLDKFPDTGVEGCPLFFIDYEIQLHKLQALKKASKKNKALNADKELAEKTLQDMDKFFSEQLFDVCGKDEDNSSPYEQGLQEWLQKNDQLQWQLKYKKRHQLFHWVKAFSVLSGLLSTLAISYLFAETIAAIPALALLMASSVFGGPLLMLAAVLLIFAGVAAFMLTYESMTNLIHNDSIMRWYNNLKEQLSTEGLSWKNALRCLASVSLVLLTLALTLCTAGTWLSIAKTGRPLFSIFSKLPSFIMIAINPVVLGSSAGSFNISNTCETNAQLSNAEVTNPIDYLKKKFKKLERKENLFQRLNPFRILIKLTIIPLRVILFIGHLASIGVTADRVPGISKLFTALLGVIAEGFEDFHYFLSMGEHKHHDKKDTKDLLRQRHDSEGGHDHSNDIPTQLIKLVLSPIYLLASIWDWGFSQSNANDPNRKVRSLSKACEKQELFIFDYPFLKKHLSESQNNEQKHKGRGVADKDEGETPWKDPSTDWRATQAIYRIERHVEKHLNHARLDKPLALLKKEQLRALQEDIKENPQYVEKILGNAITDDEAAYNQHRLFSSNKPTRTQCFLHSLSERIHSPAR